MGSPQIDLTQPHFSTKIYRAYLLYLKKHYPALNVEEICISCGLSKEYLESESNWVSVKFESMFSRKLLELTGDSNLHRKVGSIALDKDVIGSLIHHFVKYLPNVRFMYTHVPGFTSTVNNINDVKLVAVGKNTAQIRITCKKDALSPEEQAMMKDLMPFIAQNMLGYYSALPTLKGLPHAESSLESSSDEHGLPSYSMRFEFKEKYSWITNRVTVSAAFGMLAGLGAWFIFSSNLAIFASALVSFLASALILSTFALRQVQRVAEQTEIALRRLNDENRRTYEANERANAHLLRLQTLERVSNQISSARKLEDVVQGAARSVAEILEYDRCVVMLAEPANDKIKFAAQFGLPEDLAKHFQNFQLDVDPRSDDPRKLSNVFRFKKAILVNDVEQHLKDLNDEGRTMLLAAGSKSFICVPIALNDKSFGLLLADRILQNKTLNDEDVSVLEVVGQNIALALDRLQSQRREIEALQATSKMKDEFLANTTHELKTPLHGILGLSESLIAGVAGEINKKVVNDLGLIMSSAKRLLNLVDEILSMAKHHKQSPDLNTRTFNLATTLDRVVRTVSPMSARKGLKISTDVPPKLAFINADEDRVEQILVNLIGNSIKFTEKGSVRISVSEFQKGVEITVADTGIGIDKSSLEKVFEPFFQVDASVERRFGGVGLGLTITKEMAELHGGTVRIESEAGTGTKVFVTLPMARLGVSPIQEAPPIAESSIIPAEDLANVVELRPEKTQYRDTIAVVDDDPTNIAVVQNFLSGMPFNLETYTNPKEFLDSVHNGKIPNMVLLDINMPEMSGYEVCKQLRAIADSAACPVIFLTAKKEERDQVDALKVGGNDFIIKPFSRNNLIARVEAHAKTARFYRASASFVPHDSLRLLNYNSILDVRLGDKIDVPMTVMFIDIREFTNLVSTMDPKDTFRFLNSYLSVVAPVIPAHGGIIDKYIGDGIMALFLDAQSAIKAAIAISGQLADFNQKHRSGGNRRQVGCRVGLNIGPVSFGVIGYERKVEITALSDVVNTASRIESLAKRYGVTILATEEVIHAAGSNHNFPFRRLGYSQVRGRAEPIRVVEIIENLESSMSQKKMATKPDFEECVQLLESGKLARAFEGLESLAEKCPDDSVVQVFLKDVADSISKASVRFQKAS